MSHGVRGFSRCLRKGFPCVSQGYLPVSVWYCVVLLRRRLIQHSSQDAPTLSSERACDCALSAWQRKASGLIRHHRARVLPF